MSAPSITLNAKVLAFVAALYLGYKEVRLIIERATERDVQFAYLQKDVESLKQKLLKLVP
jgi:hypothetical protein